ncbi:holo-[acyl-carrier protein] synthase [Desulfitispora alkaliphila]|uniref:holo-ACP synthase n=1 Tax=Desulfitispora alkaliphila TaxID=622674 RepID=UPI003D1EA049
MVIGIGTDIVEIERVKSACERWPGFGGRIYTDHELEYCSGKSEKNYQSLAARFAAKEAVVKALGTGLRGLEWNEIEISNDLAGAPYVTLTGKAKEIAQEKGVSKVLISLSHSENHAVAYAIALGGE